MKAPGIVDEPGPATQVGGPVDPGTGAGGAPGGRGLTSPGGSGVGAVGGNT